MSEVTGQAFVSVDRQYHPDANDNTAYTRVNLGMDIDIQANVDVLEMGRYERDGEKPGTSDVYIEDFALGYINNQAYFDANPKAPNHRKHDGSAYAEGEIVPFFIQNPFLEFAFDEDTDEVVGFRLGFGESMGVLSGKIETLTGNVNVDIIDRGEGLSQADSSGNLFDQLIVLLTINACTQDGSTCGSRILMSNFAFELAMGNQLQPVFFDVDDSGNFVLEVAPTRRPQPGGIGADGFRGSRDAAAWDFYEFYYINPEFRSNLKTGNFSVGDHDFDSARIQGMLIQHLNIKTRDLSQ
nr:hypothetical protein [Marinobacter sp. es.048]